MTTFRSASAYALIPDVSSADWIFSVITTEVYRIMYLADVRGCHPAPT